MTYERVGGAERPDDLRALCAECHQAVHALERRGDIALDLEGLVESDSAIQFRRAQHEAKREREADLAAKLAVFRALPLAERIRRLRRVRDETKDRELHRYMTKIERALSSAERRVHLGQDTERTRYQAAQKVRRAAEAAEDQVVASQRLLTTERLLDDLAA